MRKNLKEVFDYWKQNKSRKIGKSISTDGTTIWSYDVAIAKWIIPGSIALLNNTWYSRTTSSQQASLRNLFTGHDIVYDQMPENKFLTWSADEAR